MVGPRTHLLREKKLENGNAAGKEQRMESEEFRWHIRQTDGGDDDDEDEDEDGAALFKDH